MSKHGGKRKGSGAYEGQVRPKITTYWSQKDIEEYFTWLKKSYKKEPTLAKFVGEQLMGKAVQPIGNDEDKPFKIEGIEISVRK